MPMPKLFGGSSLKANASENGSHTDTPANDEFVPQTTTVTSGIAVPEYSDSFLDAWTAANRVLPQAKGMEKVLNKIGELTRHCHRSFFIQC